MKIAYIVPYVPNLIRTRPYNLIVHLVALGHHVEVFTLGSSKQDLADAQALRHRGAVVHYFPLPVWNSFLNSVLALPTPQPLQTVYSWQAKLAQQVAERIANKDFDVVHVEHLRGSRYGRYLKSRFPGQPLVWDSVDCISHLFEQAASQSRSWFGRFVTRFELPRTKRAEGRLICDFNHVLVTSEADRGALLELVPKGAKPAPVSVLPNGVDLDYFHPKPEVARDPDAIVFSGKMSYHANISMAKYLVGEIMPLVWKQRPSAKVLIVGKDPTAEILEFGRHPRVKVTGTVEDLRPYLWNAAVAVVPLLYGAGIQNKILEAMATSTPVVTSSRTLSALRVVAGRDILLADTPEAFANQLIKVMSGPEYAAAVGTAGLEYVKAFHDWKRITQSLADVYEKVSVG